MSAGENFRHGPYLLDNRIRTKNTSLARPLRLGMDSDVFWSCFVRSTWLELKGTYISQGAWCVRRQRRVDARVRAGWAASVDRSADGVIRKGAVVVLLGPGNRRLVAEVISVDSSGDNADILLLDQVAIGLYVRRRDGNRSTFERTERLYPVVAQYVRTEDGFRVEATELERGFAHLARPDFVAASVEKNPVLDVGPLKRKSWVFPVPISRRQALIGAVASLPLAAMSYALFVSMQQTFAASPVVTAELGGSRTEVVFRQILLNGSSGFAALTLFTGTCLLLVSRNLEE